MEFMRVIISHLLLVIKSKGKVQKSKWSLKNYTLIVGFKNFEKRKKKGKYKELINHIQKQ